MQRLGRARARARAASASSGSCATAKLAAAPDCRVPISSPSLAQRAGRSRPARSRRRASASARSRGEPFGPHSRHSDAVLAAPDPPAQLVQLGDPEALGVLDEHHGRVGHVDADLDHGRRDEHVGLARGERRHRRLLLAVAHLAVQQHEPVARAARRRAAARTRRSPRAARRTPATGRRRPSRRSAPARPAGRRRTPGARAASSSRSSLVGARALALAARRRACRSAAARAAARAGVSCRDRRSSHSASVRGIGVAVMCSTCGASPSGALLRAPRAGARRSGAARRPPRPPASGTRTSGSISACVPTTSEQLAARQLAQHLRARARAGVEPVSSASVTGSPPSRRWIVAKCCSASVSVGAISAAWQPCSTARSIAYSATTVLPLPTSPISSRCIGALARELVARSRRSRRAGRRSARTAARSASQRARQRRRLRRARVAPRARAGARARAQQRELGQQQLLEGEPLARPRSRPAGVAREVHRRQRARRGRAAARAPASRPGSGSTTSRSALARRRTSVEDLRRADSPRSPGSGRRLCDRRPRAGGRPVPLARCVTAGSACSGEPPGQERDVRRGSHRARRPCRAAPGACPAGSAATSHGWLKNVARIVPVASATVASTSGRIPRRRTGRAAIARTSTSDRRRLAGAQRGDRARLAAVPRQVLEQVADRGRPSARMPSATLPRGSVSGASSRCGRGQRTGAASSSARLSARPPANACAAARSGAPTAPRRPCPASRCSSRASRAHHDRAGGRKRRATRPRAATSRSAARRGAARARRRRRPAARSRPARAARPRRRAADQLRRSPPSPSASAASTARSVVRRVAPGDDLVLTKPTASPLREAPLRVVARGRRDRAGAHAGERLRDRLRVLLDRAIGVEHDRAASPACWLVVRADHDLLVRELGGALGGHDHVRAVRQHDDLLGRHRVDRGEQLVGRRVQRRAAVERLHAELSNSSAMPSPLTTASTPQRVAAARARPRSGMTVGGAAIGRLAVGPAGVSGGAIARVRRGGAVRGGVGAVCVACALARQPRVALADLHAHVGDVEARDLAAPANDGRRLLGLVGVDVDLQRASRRRRRAPSRRAPRAAR